jgi:hypothetical protein
MRVMVIVKANTDSRPAGCRPEVLAQMRKLNDELAQAGVLLGMGGLQPSAHGKRLRVSGGKRIVLDGPFTETKELIAGYAIWEVASMDEAFAWLARFPDTGEGEIEVRPMYEPGACGQLSSLEPKAKPIAAE